MSSRFETQSSSLLVRTALGMVTALGLALAAGLLAWHVAQGFSVRQDRLRQSVVPALKTVLEVSAAARDLRLLELQAMTGAGLDAGAGKAPAQRVAEAMTQLQAHAATDAMDARHSEAVLADLQAYQLVFEQVWAGLRSRTPLAGADASLAQLQRASTAAYDQLALALDGWRMHSEAYAEAEAAVPPALWAAHALGALACALGAAVVGGLTLRSLAQSIWPLQQATAALHAMAAGRTDFDLRIHRLDEVGRLLVTLDGMREMLSMTGLDEDEASDGAPVEVLQRGRAAQAVAAPSAVVTTRGGPVGSLELGLHGA